MPKFEKRKTRLLFTNPTKLRNDFVNTYLHMKLFVINFVLQKLSDKSSHEISSHLKCMLIENHLEI